MAEEPSFLGKFVLLLVTIGVFVGGVYDSGPGLIIAAAIGGAFIVAGAPNSWERIKTIGGTVLGLLIVFSVVEWLGRLLT